MYFPIHFELFHISLTNLNFEASQQPMQNAELRTVTVTRYITPLREGGSLPALTEADDDLNMSLNLKVQAMV